jgi:hypothetical protein
VPPPRGPRDGGVDDAGSSSTDGDGLELNVDTLLQYAAQHPQHAAFAAAACARNGWRLELLLLEEGSDGRGGGFCLNAASTLPRDVAQSRPLGGHAMLPRPAA